MNERIKQLAEQAGFYFYDMHNVDGQDLGESIEADNWSAADKLAELIVKESMDVVAKKCASPTAYNALAEHWGVEE